jgi:Paraquat-inducible protein B
MRRATIRTDPSCRPNCPDPDIEPRSRWLPSLVWVIPLIAALIGLALVIKSVTERGPTITITFVSAEGLEPGKTKVKYKDVDVGSVKTITLRKICRTCWFRCSSPRKAKTSRSRIRASGWCGLASARAACPG